MKIKTLLVCFFALVLLAQGQTAAQPPASILLKGTVTDESGAMIPGATVILKGPEGEKRFGTNESGAYVVTGITPGKYTVRIESIGFTPVQKSGLTLQPSRILTLDATLKIAVSKQQVTVEGETNTVSTEASSNAGAIILRGADLEALSDDPDDLAADLQALAGPSAGPNGGQIFIDGFSNGTLPPKASIREIRINQNPFSSEYDRLGFGRIEVFTKPGTDRFRGQAFFGISEGVFNSRNPYSDNKPSFQSRNFGGSISGPLNKKSSFSIDLERREVDDNAIINATILDSSLNPLRLSESIVTPQRRMHLTQRIDYQLTPKNTLVGRYTFMQNSTENAGIGDFSMQSRGYNADSSSHTLQLTETAMVSARVVNETRFQFLRSSRDSYGNNSVPTVNVLESFTGGGSQVGRAFNYEDRWEIQNYTSWTVNKHAFRGGVRLRYSSQNDTSPQNFGGTFTFGGGFAPILDANNQPIIGSDGKPQTAQITSLERYRRTLLFQAQGLSAAQIRLLGGGATQFSISGGDPLAGVNQADVGLFLQDDWRVRSNFTLSMGLRYETQSNISDWFDLAPRIGFAWAPGAKGGKQKTVVRGGFGMFYSRVDDNLTLQTNRYNGINQQQYIVQNPDFYPAVPLITALDAQKLPQTVRTLDSNARAPYILQSAIGVERQLPKNTTVAVTFTNSRAEHLLRSQNLTALGVAPASELNANTYQYGTGGILRQSQLITNVNSRMSRNISIFSFYVFNHAKSDTDGAGTFPANPADLRADYGRASLDVRHRFVLGSSFTTKYSFRLSPFIIASSGSPFNITAGRDLNNDSVFTDRPAFGEVGQPGVIVTQFGVFNPNPAPGAVIIPRNYGQSPGSFTINLRLSKSIAFGERSTAQGAPPSGEMRGPGGGGPPDGGHGHSGGGPGGMRMSSGGGHSMFDGGSASGRFSLTFSVSAHNLLNHVNPGSPIGNLTSPLFGQSTSLAGGFGPGGSSVANNRRLEFQVRFSF
jgi:hypothetical protein